MEENQNQEQQVQQNETSGAGVSFPTVGQPTKKSSGAKTLLVIGILALVAILGFVIFKNASSENTNEATPTPFVETPTEEPVATPTSTSKPADKSKVKIEIQNGTGITGEAAYLQTQLKSLGYTNITVGNASSQDATATIVTFAKSLSAEIVDELTKKLKELYKEVTVKTSTTATMDAVIITGLRKGTTAKPSSTPTASGTPKPSVSASASASPSPTTTPQ